MKFKVTFILFRKKRFVYSLTKDYLYRSYSSIFEDLKDLRVSYKNAIIQIQIFDGKNQLLYKSFCNNVADEDKMVDQILFFKNATKQYNRLLSS